MNKYECIINHNRPKSHYHKMSMHDRAAQFSPFAVLMGYEDAISGTARRVDRKIALSEEEKEALDRKTDLILEKTDSEVEFTQFAPNRKKRAVFMSPFGELSRKLTRLKEKSL